MMTEKISALIDQQGSPRQKQAAFDHLLADDDACRVWQRYHLIGCVLRGEVRQTGTDLSVRIRAQLEREPTVLAPMRARAIPWKPVGLLALAASVALAAVLIVNPAFNPAGESGVNRIADNSDGAGFEQVGFEQAGFESTRFEPVFSEMLAQHGEFTSSPGLNGLVAYAKLVSNAPIKR